MLGFWIIISHLVGAYFLTSEYFQERAVNSTTFALGASILYMIPFLLFLPGSPFSFLAVLVFRFIVLRLGVPDYLIWVRNLMSPREKRSDRVMREQAIDTSGASFNQIVSIHAASTALHSITIALAIIIL